MENRLKKKKIAATRVKIFFITRISGKKSIFLPNVLIFMTKVEGGW